MAYLLIKKGGQKKKNKKGKQEHPHPYLCMFLHVRKLHDIQCHYHRPFYYHSFLLRKIELDFVTKFRWVIRLR